MSVTDPIVQELADFLNSQYKPYLDQHCGPNSKFLLLHLCIRVPVSEGDPRGSRHGPAWPIRPGRAGRSFACRRDGLRGRTRSRTGRRTLLRSSMSGSRSLSLTTRSSRCWPWSTGPAVPYKLFGLLGENPTYEEETAVHETQAHKCSNLIRPRPSRRQICTSSKLLARHSPRRSPENETPGSSRNCINQRSEYQEGR